MTNDELLALKAKAEAATPGDWHLHTLNGRLPNVMRRKMPHGEADTFYSTIFSPENTQVVVLDFGYGRKTDEAKALYIVAACNAVPGLVDEVLRLREENANLEKQVDGYFNELRSLK
jgi:hypothetical protein